MTYYYHNWMLRLETTHYFYNFEMFQNLKIFLQFSPLLTCNVVTAVINQDA
jgi:hypothetical protein